MSTPSDPQIVRQVDGVVGKVAAVGMGQVSNNSHPLHPCEQFSAAISKSADSLNVAIVHWPIALLTTAYACDGLTLLRRLVKVPDVVDTFLPPNTTTEILSHYLTAAGLLSAIPVVLTGLAELYGMYKGMANDKGHEKVNPHATRLRDSLMSERRPSKRL